MNKQIICFACGALVPDIDGSTHKYMHSAPGCWKLYGEILAKEYAQYDPDIHRVTVDTYAVTHPGNKERRAIQSVNGHLISLYCLFEKHMSGRQATQILKQVVENKTITDTFTWLEPPSFQGTKHVTDVLKERNFEEYKELVRAWGRSVWQVWKEKHLQVIETIIAKLGV